MTVSAEFEKVLVIQKKLKKETQEQNKDQNAMGFERNNFKLHLYTYKSPTAANMAWRTRGKWATTNLESNPNCFAIQ